MKAVLDQKVNEIATLNSQLLSSLDESLFFGKLGQFVQDLYSNESVLVFLSLEEGASRLIAKNGEILSEAQDFKKGHGLAGYVARTKRAYYSNCVERDPLLAGVKYDSAVKCEIAAPILIDGEVLGTIHVLSEDAERSYSESDIADVQEILNRLELPLKNMKMYLAAKNLNKQLLKKIEEREQEIASNKTISIDSEFTSRKVELIGQSKEFHDLLGRVSKVAASEANIIVRGESGTGKEMICRRIHNQSQRANGPFVVVNCSAIKESLLEAELFGVVKGSFTGALNDREGLLERAHGGTLVFDEITELTPSMQAKILRFIESGEGYRVGSHKSFKANVRIAALTNKDLNAAVEEGTFREDLLFRLNTMRIDVPALTERQDDIRVLAQHFLNEGCSDEEMKSLTSTAIEALSGYRFPGNVRELRNIMERVRVMADGRFIDINDLPECVIDREEAVVEVIEEYVEMTLESLEKGHIVKTLEHLNGNKTKTAKALGITVKTLYNKLHSYGMVQPRS